MLVCQFSIGSLGDLETDGATKSYLIAATLLSLIVLPCDHYLSYHII